MSLKQQQSVQAPSMTPKDLMKQWRHDKNENPFFINFLNSVSYPREEAFYDMLTYSIFSTYKFRSLTTILMLMNLLFYSGTLIYDGIVQGGYLLEPSQKALFDFGMSYPYFTLYDGQIHRLYLSLFLYCNFTHFFTCQIGWAIYGSYVERLVGWKMLWMIGILGGVAGTLLSCSLSPIPHVNGSSPPAAFIGFLLGYLVIRFDQWDYSGSGRWQMLGWLLFGIALICWECSWWVLDDHVGIVGSIFVGFCCCMALTGSFENDRNSFRSDSKCTSYMAIGVLLVYYCTTIVYFIKFSKPILLSN